jgi:hypothetical protein
MPLNPESLESLITGFAGQILQPNDTGYDEARQLHNGSIDKRPALIARGSVRSQVTRREQPMGPLPQRGLGRQLCHQR